MIETTPFTTFSSPAGLDTPLCLLAGPPSLKALAEALSGSGMACAYSPLALEDETGATDLSYKRLAPLLTQAREEGYQLVVAAQPAENKLSVAVRKTADGPLLLLSTHQLAVLLADALTGDDETCSLVCVRSMVLTDLLETLLVKRGYTCKTELLATETLPQVLETTLAETGADRVLVITEGGEFYGNKGFDFVVEQLLALHQRLAAEQQSLFDQLLALYYRYGFYREKTLVVSLDQASQAAHYAHLMDYFRKLKKPEVGSYAIKEIWDYQRKKAVNWISRKQLKLENEPFNLMKVVFEEGMNLMLVPTEQKMYLHLSLSGKMMHKGHYDTMSRDFDQKLLKLVALVNQQ